MRPVRRENLLDNATQRPERFLLAQVLEEDRGYKVKPLAVANVGVAEAEGAEDSLEGLLAGVGLQEGTGNGGAVQVLHYLDLVLSWVGLEPPQQLWVAGQRGFLQFPPVGQLPPEVLPQRLGYAIFLPCQLALFVPRYDPAWCGPRPAARRPRGHPGCCRTTSRGPASSCGPQGPATASALSREGCWSGTCGREARDSPARRAAS